MSIEDNNSQQPKRIGLLIGRFQPFHNGHLGIIKQMSEDCDQIIIVIGSAQISHTKYNPFTASERYQMVYETLKSDFDMSKIHIIPVIDIGRYELYVKHIESLVPPFDVVYSASPTTLQLFTEADYDVVVPIYTNLSKGQKSSRLTASLVRDAMQNPTNPADWTHFVPQGTIDVVEKIDGIKRVKMIHRGD